MTIHYQLTFAGKCVCSSAWGVMRFVGDNELATSAYEISELSTVLAVPLKTATMLVSDGFWVTIAESGGAAGLTVWNVLRWWLPTGLGCCPVSVGAGAAMLSVRRSMVSGLSGWTWTWLPDIWRNRGLSAGGPTTASLCRIWLRSISSRVDAFWCPAISWIPVPAGLVQPHPWQHILTPVTYTLWKIFNIMYAAYRVWQKSGPLKFFAVFSATVWDFNIKFYSLI